ncbi:hypothetical protein PhaeoP23_02216 [Phaeobacter piscinae]|uniref:Uncharacterized protein n=1 Tax=Phaeobacter piscinae TaxID=1580596 RepID=A0ABN5DFW0_9RHOB|nr:hypothetical protein PhaeoP36_02216 [Phaeobacter piscinae]AUQ86862.1 hypothetical protein PhaeoP42_02217 [Phaeobacter piscinae]AUR24745.1 hypothetical protein PhaeoP23_02216 [Phaeobacter piscinae]
MRTVYSAAVRVGVLCDFIRAGGGGRNCTNPAAPDQLQTRAAFSPKDLYRFHSRSSELRLDWRTTWA